MTQRTLQSSAATEEALRTLWGDRGIDPSRIEWRAGTAVAQRAQVPSEHHWERGLPALLEADGRGGDAQLELNDVLGEGGMGVVYSAQQLALKRSVAVKLPHPSANDQESGLNILREARVAGLLEHPNVVPVYALGRDPDGRPLIVMRRVAGTTWAEKINSTTFSTHAGDDYLSTHLRILQQVAMAAHFAHDKGIVHRDIKPENVMVCGFGEVYLADWGIAVSIGAPVPDVPAAADVCEIEGTPGYLAPEMAAGAGDSIDARTDVYLLGAVLHEIVTGAPPHGNGDIMAALERAFVSKPHDYGPEVPPKLAEIIRRAMGRFPEDRYASAAHFARAIDNFLDHRAAMDLTAEAHQRLKKLKSLVKRQSQASKHASQEAQTAEERTSSGRGTKRAEEARRADRKIRTLFNECRFAFAHATRNYPQVASSKAGLRDTTVVMIGYELDNRRPDAAAALLRDLRRPPEQLARRVKTALKRQAEKEARLRKLERDADAQFGADTRARLTMVVAVLWGTTCVTSGVLTRTGTFPIEHFEFAALNGVFLVLVGGSAIATRRTMLGSGPNRRLSAISSLVFAGFALLWLLMGSLGVGRQDTALVHCLMGAMVWLCAAVAVEKRWAILSLGQAVSFALIWQFREYHYEIMGVLVSIGSIVTTWLSQRSAKPTSPRA